MKQTTATVQSGSAHELELSPVDETGLSGWLLVFAFAAVGVVRPNLAQNFAVIDLALFLLIFIWMLRTIRGSRSEDLLIALVPAIGLIFIGSLIASLHVGVTSFVVDDLLRDVGAFATFLAVVDVLRRGSRSLIARTTWAVGLMVVALTTHLVFFDDGLRGTATFPNPNIPGHLLALAALLFVMAPIWTPAKVVLTVVSLVGMYRTGSFGASLEFAAGIMLIFVVSIRSRTVDDRRRRLALLCGMAAIVGSLVVVGTQMIPETPEASGLATSRLDRSGGTRLEVWSEAWSEFVDRPLGSGPGSHRALETLELATEVHNEPLSYLTERGVLGLIGLVMLWTVLWRRSMPGGRARVLLTAYIVASMFRETLHYRHWWLFLALAMVTDEIVAPPSFNRRLSERGP